MAAIRTTPLHPPYQPESPAGHAVPRTPRTSRAPPDTSHTASWPPSCFNASAPPLTLWTAAGGNCDRWPTICRFQPFLDTATGLIAGVEALAPHQGRGGLCSVGPLFADPKTNQSSAALRPEMRERALACLHRGTRGLVPQPQHLAALDQPPAPQPAAAEPQAADPQRHRPRPGGVRDHRAERHQPALSKRSDGTAPPARASPSTTSAPATRSSTGCWPCSRTSSSWTCACSRTPPAAGRAARWSRRWRRWPRRPAAGSSPRGWKPPTS